MVPCNRMILASNDTHRHGGVWGLSVVQQALRLDARVRHAQSSPTEGSTDHGTPPPPLSKLRPCPSYSGRRDRTTSVPNLIRYGM